MNIWQFTKSSVFNAVALESNYKVLTRWYLVLSKIAKTIPSYSLNCFRGCAEDGTHLHIWWTCHIVFRMLFFLFDISLLPDPTIELLNKRPLELTSLTSNVCLLETNNRITQFMIHSKI